MTYRAECPECCETVKECTQCNAKFESQGQYIVCIGDEKNHFCSIDCFHLWLQREYEEETTIAETYIELIDEDVKE